MNWDLRHERSRVSTRGIEEIGNDFDIYKAPQSQSGRTAWEVTERLIVEMYSDVVNRKRKFGLLTITTPLQVHPDAEIRKRIIEKHSSWDLFYTEERLAELARRHDFPILTLARPLQEYSERENVFLHGFPNTQPGTGHWNESGHKVAGQKLADWLETEVLR